MTESHIKLVGRDMYRFQPYSDSKGIRADRIQREKIWFSLPRALNDPMDVDHPIDDLMAGTEVSESKLRMLAKIMYSPGDSAYPKGLIDDDLLAIINQFSESSSDSLALIQAYRERFLQLGVACFTPNWDCPPMWGHYAENWKGFSLQYRTFQCQMAKAEKNESIWQFWVNYSSRLTQISVSELLFSPYEAASRVLSVKTIPWSYENEWRLVALSGGDVNHDVPEGMELSGIILGPKSPSDQTALLEEKCRAWNLPLWQVNVGLDRTIHRRSLWTPTE